MPENAGRIRESTGKRKAHALKFFEDGKLPLILGTLNRPRKVAHSICLSCIPRDISSHTSGRPVPLSVQFEMPGRLEVDSQQVRFIPAHGMHGCEDALEPYGLVIV
jgi:hypothetical protein